MSGSSFIVMLVHTHADAGSVCLFPQWICIQTPAMRSPIKHVTAKCYTDVYLS